MNHTTTTWLTRHLFDVRIDAVTTQQVLNAVDDAIKRRTRLLISVVNAAKMVNMDRDPALRRAVLGADLILADGMSIVWACRLFRSPLPERVAGIDLMRCMLERCDRNGHAVYLLGAEENVLAVARERVAQDYPGARIVGSRHGYYPATDEAQVAENIRDVKPDILFVAMSSPRKERFIAKWAHRMDVPVYHGVGGAFDVLAGKVRRAPKVIQRMGLEWAFRAAQEPRRLLSRYLDTNTVFAAKVMQEALQRSRRVLFGIDAPAKAAIRPLRVRHH
ncbi:MAG: WecB/TagA/CpsF family glycosyltransferase [Phycisphaerae bacterium]|nr:WecB/TagA/CpsF family glycosyltransferase [Phycisphaerae bacterium]